MTAAIASLATIVASRVRCMCRQHPNGSVERGCGYTEHGLFDDAGTELRIATLNGLEIAYVARQADAYEEEEEGPP